MNLLCKVGWHRFTPAKVFSSQESTTKIWVVSISGHQCNCGKRKIKVDEFQGQSPYATQEAYDWLNQRPPKAQVLNVINGGRR